MKTINIIHSAILCNIFKTGSPKIIKQSCLKLLVLLILLSYSGQLTAQKKYERKISVREWVDEMRNCKKEIYILRNTKIFYDMEKDTAFQADTSFNPLKRKPIVPNITIDAEIVLWDCILPTISSCLSNIEFKQSITFLNSESSSFKFVSCIFRGDIQFASGNLGAFIFNDCEFYHRICSSDSKLSILELEDCTVSLTGDEHKSMFQVNSTEFDERMFLYILNPSSSINIFQIKKCKIEGKVDSPIFEFGVGKLDILVFEDTDFKESIFNFNGSVIKHGFEIKNCKFNRPIGMDGFDFPAKGTNFNWTQIEEHGICLWDHKEKQSYAANDTADFADNYKYSKLMASYNSLYRMYKVRGDIESANRCFIKMKHIDKKRLKYQYQHDRTLKNYFNWTLSRCLGYFCLYGTSPIRALIISLWVIVIFSVFYFFFYTENMEVEKFSLIKSYKNIVKYFTSENNLEELYKEQYSKEMESNKVFKELIKKNSVQLPLIVNFMGKPLYKMSEIRFRIACFVYRKAELLNGKWNDLNSKQKLKVGTIMFFYISLFLLTHLFIRCLNAVFLSVNTFSTLGFGKIPLKNIAKYVAILEGFIGWFLLSMFSVSLISQILQN